ncbi:hypothetical protein [Rubritalea tangerina]
MHTQKLTAETQQFKREVLLHFSHELPKIPPCASRSPSLVSFSSLS